MFESWPKPLNRNLRLSSILNSQSWIIGLSVSLVILHLTLVWRVNTQIDDLVLNAAFWFTLYPKLLSKYRSSNNSHQLWASLLGSILVLSILLRCISFIWFEASFVKLIPLLIIIGLGLIASGAKISKYWPEALLTLPLMIPQTLLMYGMNHTLGWSLQLITAKWAGFVLYYLGFSVMVQQDLIFLPQGSIRVELACTAFPVLLALLQLWVVFCALTPMNWKRHILELALISLIAQVLSTVRVSLLAFWVHQPELFSFWHDEYGKQIFSTIIIVAFAAIHYALSTQPHQYSNE